MITSFRRMLLYATVVAAVAAALSQAATARQTPEGALVERARALMRSVPLIDGHNDIPWAMRETAGYDFGKKDLRAAQPTLMTDIDRLRQGLVGAQFWSVYVPASLQGRGAVTATLEQIDAVYEMARRYPDVFELARTADDVERAFRAGKIASLIGMEGGHSIDSSLGALRMFSRMGVGYMTLTHGDNVPWADSGTDEPKLGGLSRFGEAVVAEMNWLGMLVDLSHVSPETMHDALRVSEAPVIFSHSSARALCDVPRNVPDEVLSTLPQNGGVVMVTFVPGFISPEVAAWERREDAERKRLRQDHSNNEAAQRQALDAWQAANPKPKATLAQVADHIDHVRKVAGIDHVGIGSDFDGIDAPPVGLEDVSKFPALAAELLRRGYTDDEVKKVVGLNLLRVMRAAERTAARLQAARAPSVVTIGSVK